MKYLFLLDENVLRHAVASAGMYGKPDAPTAQVIRLIGQNCHSVVLDPEIRSRYRRHLDEIGSLTWDHAGFALSVLTSFFGLLGTAEKVGEDPLSPPLLETQIEEAIPVKDRFAVRAAVRHHAILVTNDDTLRARVDEFVTPRFPDVRALHPTEACSGFANQT
ncbi:MAG: hypothetical protein HYY93_15090 [Planctomycetes bacterium]|nr:hypothetical protein [Planctomycetota bacterium]